jgi:hypothetical protein
MLIQTLLGEIVRGIREITQSASETATHMR